MQPLPYDPQGLLTSGLDEAFGADFIFVKNKRPLLPDPVATGKNGNETTFDSKNRDHTLNFDSDQDLDLEQLQQQVQSACSNMKTQDLLSISSTNSVPLKHSQTPKQYLKEKTKVVTKRSSKVKKEINKKGKLIMCKSKTEETKNTTTFAAPLAENRESHQDSQKNISPQVYVKTMNDVKWNEQFIKLKMYQEMNNGSTDVPRNYTSDPSLAAWVKTQREKHILSDGSYPAYRTQLLNTVGFNWKLRTSWDVMFERLKDYKSQFGTTCVCLTDQIKIQEILDNNKRREKRKDPLNVAGYFNANKEDASREPKNKLPIINSTIYTGIDGATKSASCDTESDGATIDATRDTEIDSVTKDDASGIKNGRTTIDSTSGSEMNGARNDATCATKNDRESNSDSFSDDDRDEQQRVFLSALKDDIPVLRNWVFRQRYNCRSGNITKERLSMLESIGFCWEKLRNMKLTEGHQENDDRSINEMQEEEKCYNTEETDDFINDKSITLNPLCNTTKTATESDDPVCPKSQPNGQETNVSNNLSKVISATSKPTKNMLPDPATSTLNSKEVSDVGLDGNGNVHAPYTLSPTIDPLSPNFDVGILEL
jgi:hypothetical protein